MPADKLSPEEELEKQYNDYKAQFEQWKERNRESVGTDAYIKYVKSFENWERDVEKRRAAVRQKAEQERLAAEKKAVEKKATELRQKQSEEAAALAYAQGQSQYMRMHQRAMQQEEDIPRAKPIQPARITFAQSTFSVSSLAASAPIPEQIPMQQLPVPMQQLPVPMQQIPVQMETYERRQVEVEQPMQGPQPRPENPAGTDTNYMSVMQQMLNFMASDNKHVNGDSLDKAVPQMISATDQLPVQPQPNPLMNQPVLDTNAPPQLWGNEGASYPATDQMFRRWNVRGAPPNFKVPYLPPPPGTPTTPCWYVLKTMQERNLVFAPQLNVPPPGMPLANFSSFNVPPPNLSMPPPVSLLGNM